MLCLMEERQLKGSIRLAIREDLPQLTALWEELMGMHAGLHQAFALAPNALRLARQSLGARLRDPHTRIFTYDKEGKLHGMLIAHYESSQSFHRLQRRGYIAETIVRAPHRGTGIGKRLVNAACDWLYAMGADYVELQVAPANLSALDFWEGQGFGPLTLHMARLRPEKEPPA